MAVQTALLGAICRGARLRGLAPIMIDWSDPGQGRNGLFAAVCNRQRGLPLLSWVSRPDELDPAQSRAEEFFLRRLLYHLPQIIRALLLTDRGCGRASLIRFVQQMPRHTGYPVDYAIRPRRDVIVQSVDYRGRLRDYPLRKGRTLLRPQTRYRSDGAMIINLILYWAQGHREPWYLATSLADPGRAVRMYRKRMQPEHHIKRLPRAATRGAQATLQAGSEHGAHHRPTATVLVGLLLACRLLVLAGLRVSPTFRRQVCSRGKPGILHLGYEHCVASPDPTPLYVSSRSNRVRVRGESRLSAACQHSRQFPGTCPQPLQAVKWAPSTLPTEHAAPRPMPGW